MIAARVEMLGIDPMRVARAAAATDRVSLRHMGDAMERAMGLIETEARRSAPKRTGELSRNYTHTVERQGDNVLGIAFNLLDKAEWVERGTGLYRVGPGPKRMIRSRTPGKSLAIPRADLRNPRTRGSGSILFTKGVRGQRPQWVMRRAHVAVRPLLTPIFSDAARRARDELKGML